MRRGNQFYLYNVFFPFFIMMWLPGIWWIIVIPVDYVIDRLVLYYSTGQVEDRNEFCRKHTWKICLAGFVADLAGGLFMLATLLITSKATRLITGQASGFPYPEAMDAFIRFSSSVMYNPFHHPAALALTLTAILLSSVLIYQIDRRILQKTGLMADQAKNAALRLAVITAPYYFLLPVTLFFD